MIPSSPPQADPWDDDDIIFPSDSELDQYTVVPPKYAVRRPVFQLSSASKQIANGDSSRLKSGGTSERLVPGKDVQSIPASISASPPGSPVLSKVSFKKQQTLYIIHFFCRSAS